MRNIQKMFSIFHHAVKQNKTQAFMHAYYNLSESFKNQTLLNSKYILSSIIQNYIYVKLVIKEKFPFLKSLLYLCILFVYDYSTLGICEI